MMTLTDAQRIVALYGKLENAKKRLAEIDSARADGTGISVLFKQKNRSGNWGDVDGLKYVAMFRTGELNDIAAIVLARLSDEVAAQKRQIERELLWLGACP